MESYSGKHRRPRSMKHTSVGQKAETGRWPPCECCALFCPFLLLLPTVEYDRRKLVCMRQGQAPIHQQNNLFLPRTKYPSSPIDPCLAASVRRSLLATLAYASGPLHPVRILGCVACADQPVHAGSRLHDVDTDDDGDCPQTLPSALGRKSRVVEGQHP